MQLKSATVPHIRSRQPDGFAWRERLRLWFRRHRTRQTLRDLDRNQLADIGVSEEQRTLECAKPFWRP
jgi:uncharacterized protein YjiS (DUF1127 family)